MKQQLIILNKIKVIYELLAKAKLEIALEELLEITNIIADKNFRHRATLISARYYSTKEQLIKGIDPVNSNEVRNKIIDSIINLVADIDDTVKQVDNFVISKNTSIESNDVFKLLGEFRERSDSLYNPSNEELTNVYELKVSLYDRIFKKFDEKLKFIPNLRRKEAKVLFNRIIDNRIQLTEVDKSVLYQITKSREYEWYEKTMIISALFLSISKKFNEEKTHLLIDFLVQFEDKVWQYALVATILVINNYDEKVFLYNNIIARLKKLKDINEVQDTLKYVDMILSNGIYKLNILSVKTKYDSQNIFEGAIERVLPIFKRLEKEFFSLLIEESISPIYKEVILHFRESQIPLRLVSSQSESEYIDVPEHFKNLYNWFIPFYEENPLIRDSFFRSKFNFDTRAFISLLSESVLLSDVSKYSIIVNIDRMSKDKFEEILILLANEKYSIKELVKLLTDEATPWEGIVDARNRKMIFNYIRNISEFVESYKSIDYKKILPNRIKFYDSSISDMVVANKSENYIKLLSDKKIKDGLKSQKKTVKLNNSQVKKFANSIITENNKLNIDLTKIISENDLEKVISLVTDGSSLKQEHLDLYNQFFNLKVYKDLHEYIKSKEHKKIIELIKIPTFPIPNNKYLLKEIAFACYYESEMILSLKYFHLLEKIIPEDSQTKSNIAYCYLTMERFEMVEKYCTEAISLDKDNFYAYKNLGLKYVLLEDFAQATSYIKKAIRMGKKEIFDVLISDFDYIQDKLPYDRKSYEDFLSSLMSISK